MAKLKWETIGILFLSIILILSLKNFIPVLEPFNSQTNENDGANIDYIKENKEDINIVYPNCYSVLPSDDIHSSS